MSLLTQKQRHRMFENAGWRCRECGGTGGLTLDHIVPRSRGGTNALENLRVLCGECNGKKADKMPSEVPPGLWVTCTRCSGRGVLDKPFGRRCATCEDKGRLPGERAALRPNRKQRRLMGQAG
jgi:hypothetical protein